MVAKKQTADPVETGKAHDAGKAATTGNTGKDTGSSAKVSNSTYMESSDR